MNNLLHIREGFKLKTTRLRYWHSYNYAIKSAVIHICRIILIFLLSRNKSKNINYSGFFNSLHSIFGNWKKILSVNSYVIKFWFSEEESSTWNVSFKLSRKRLKKSKQFIQICMFWAAVIVQHVAVGFWWILNLWAFKSFSFIFAITVCTFKFMNDTRFLNFSMSLVLLSI